MAINVCDNKAFKNCDAKNGTRILSILKSIREMIAQA
jgi:hypothetical protein